MASTIERSIGSALGKHGYTFNNAAYGRLFRGENMNNRERFEAWAKAPPRELGISRFRSGSSWEGQYMNYSTQCAWEAWQAAQHDGGENNETR